MSLLFHPDLLAVEVAGDTTVVKLRSARFADHNAQAIGQQLADLVDRLGGTSCTWTWAGWSSCPAWGWPNSSL